jgi:hypothetical protein
MKDKIKELAQLIEKSEKLLSQSLVTSNEINDYKSCINSTLSNIINTETDETIVDISRRCLQIKIKRITNPISQKIQSFLDNREAFTFNAPFLIKHTDSDYNKRYIFWTKQSLDGIKHNYLIKEKKRS